MQLREYQTEAVNAIYGYFLEKEGHPLIVMPTASGKSVVLAAFIKETLKHWPDQRILLLTHVKELIQQNYLELVGRWDLAPAGVYSAGLKRRDSGAQILFAGIQSVHNKADEIGACDLILIDEAHLCPRSSDTMYRRFIDEMTTLNDQVKIIGFTATHYRLDSGLLTEGENRVFTDVAYEVSVKRLIDEKWLAPLITKAPSTGLDVSGVHTRGGEFIPGELAAAVDKEEVNGAAVREIVNYGRDRKSWLIFCTGVDHVSPLVVLRL
jgi:DNA repair protein RadD